MKGIKELEAKLKELLIKEAWEARKVWLEMEKYDSSVFSFQEKVHQCGYYHFIRKKIKGQIPLGEKYKGTPIGFSIKLGE